MHKTPLSGHQPQDHSYRLLFSHPDMIADLLRGYVRQSWVEHLDFASLEPAEGRYVTDDLRTREDDLIWRVKWADGERWLYIHLLLEFQSTPDAFMALRVLTYLGLLYQDLIKTGQLTPEGNLPPVLPLVLYNGERPWRAHTEIGDLIAAIPGGLEAYRPQLRYLLLDENRYAGDPLPSTRNLVAALFGLENSRSPADVRRMLEHLIQWLGDPSQTTLRRHFVVWLKRVLLPSRMGGIHFDQVNDLQEIDSMLAERVKDWTRDWREQGIKQGIEEGIEQGIKQGIEEGIGQGIAQGIEKGRVEGELAVLTRLLTRRFGTLDAATTQRLQQATTADLERWADNILDAHSLEEVFAER